MATSRYRYHPELRGARFIPNLSYSPWLVRLMNRGRPPGEDPGPDVSVAEVPLADGASMRFFRPVDSTDPVPALLWVHGGGHLIGSPEQDDRTNIAFARELGVAVAAVRYRRGIEAPAPAAVDDCWSALTTLSSRADELGVDAGRLAVGGASAGGGIAAGLVLLAHDRGDVPVRFQLLVYPMLDDRTAVRRGHDTRRVRIWTPRSNHYGWRTYLGVDPGSDDVSAYAAPARRTDLSGLPPTWIGVGDADLFHDEDVDYARRLQDAGVPCELLVLPGVVHGFDAVWRRSQVARTFWQHQADALRGAGIATPVP